MADVTTGTQGHPSLAFDKDGTAWCAWEDARSGPNNMRIYAADSKTRKNVQINEVPKKAPESLHWLAAAPGGEVFVAWLDLRNREKGQDLAWVKITDQGRKIGKNQIIPGPLCECCAPGLAVDAKGNPTLIYREGGKNANRALLMATGASLSRIARINQGDSKVDS